jgi:hypothetical protein
MLAVTFSRVMGSSVVLRSQFHHAVVVALNKSHMLHHVLLFVWQCSASLCHHRELFWGVKLHVPCDFTDYSAQDG